MPNYKKPNRPAIKSNAKSLPIIDYGSTSRNHGTMVKIIKANHDEKEVEEIIGDSVDVLMRIINDETPEERDARYNYLDQLEINELIQDEEKYES